MSPPQCESIVVVVVDDETSFRAGLAANLEDDEHLVAQYDDPKRVPPEVLQRAHVLVTDYRMGLAFADEVHAARPDLAIVLATAYWTVEIEAEVAPRGFIQLCRKPIDYDDLHELVHRLAVAGS